MSKIILQSGEAASTGEVFSNHLMVGRESGTQDVVVEMANAKSDLTAESSWMATNVVLDDETEIKPVFTSKGFAVRVRVDHATTHDCVVSVDILNEPAEYRNGPLR